MPTEIIAYSQQTTNRLADELSVMAPISTIEAWVSILPPSS